MPARHVFRIGCATLLLLSSRMAVASDDAPPLQEAADDRVAQILKEWHRRSAATTSLDVRFEGWNTRAGYGRTRITGRVALLPKGRALFEVVTPKSQTTTASVERLVWTEEALHLITVETKTHVIRPIAAENKGRLPAVIAIPFLWGVTPETLTAKYRVELLKEEPEVFILRITPRLNKDSKNTFQAYLSLDRATYLPRRYMVVTDDGNTTKDYSVTTAWRNQPIPDEDLRLPPDEGWQVTRLEGPLGWFGRLFAPDYLP